MSFLRKINIRTGESLKIGHDEVSDLLRLAIIQSNEERRQRIAALPEPVAPDLPLPRTEAEWLKLDHEREQNYWRYMDETEPDQDFETDDQECEEV